MTRRSFFQIAGVGSALVGAGAASLLVAPDGAESTSDLQACLDAGRPLPAGVHVVSRTLFTRGPVVGAGSGRTVLVAGAALAGPVLAGAAAFRAADLTVRVGEHHVHFGGAGVVVARLG